jgi:hypothetical protein
VLSYRRQYLANLLFTAAAIFRDIFGWRANSIPQVSEST